ncbi:DNA repair protein RecO [bacterium]|nr:MAG: DNA repair protein RecO [bacterium]
MVRAPAGDRGRGRRRRTRAFESRAHARAPHPSRARSARRPARGRGRIPAVSLPRAYRAHAIVLRGRNLGEADRALSLLTLERGKLDAVAKGVRRGDSRLSGRLELLSEVDASFHRGRSLDVITGADPVTSYWQRLVTPEAFAVASVVAELVDAFCEPELPVPAVYRLLRGATAAIAGRGEARRVLARFELRLLDELGLGIPLDACMHCQRALAEQAVVDLSVGGLACPSCLRPEGNTVLDAGELVALQHLGAPKGQGASLRAGAKVARAVETLIVHHLGKTARSLAALDALAPE